MIPGLDIEIITEEVIPAIPEVMPEADEVVAMMLAPSMPIEITV
jgi:hypothetical protein